MLLRCQRAQQGHASCSRRHQLLLLLLPGWGGHRWQPAVGAVLPVVVPEMLLLPAWRLRLPVDM